jgi:Tfp pilus assembly protein PilO
LALNKQEKTTAVILLVVILGIITSVRIFPPLIKKWPRQSAEIKHKKELIKINHLLINQEDELAREFSVLSKKMQAKLPLGGGQSEFLTELGRVAQETNVHIKTMNPRPLKDLDFFKELSVEIDMEANLGNLVRFLYEMRKSSVVLVANRLRLKPKSERSALLEGHLVISTIFLKEK